VIGDEGSFQREAHLRGLQGRASQGPRVYYLFDKSAPQTAAGLMWAFFG